LIVELEQQLLEKDNELAALRDSLSQAEDVSRTGDDLQAPDQGPVANAPPHDASQGLPEFMEDTQDEETTLVAEDTSVLSLSADDGSSPELIVHQSESPEESKGTSSDEMITSSDSEVAQSSWTLLEAVNQDGGQEWPPTLQESGHLQRSWEAASMEVEPSPAQAESPSAAIPQPDPSSSDRNVSSGQVFAQAFVEELQRKCSDLLLEVERLREAAAESAGKMKLLQEDVEALAAAKEASEVQASSVAEELQLAREQLEKLSRENMSSAEKHGVEMQLLEEQLDILNATVEAKEEKIQNLQTEREAQVKMLSAQLEDRELVSSQLERKVQDMENSMSEYSQTSELNSDALSKKDSEISELQLLLSQKEEEVSTLGESMSAKLLQAEEERLQVDREVGQLRERVEQLERSKEENVWNAPTDEELRALQQEKGELELQLSAMKKKLQAALVQRKELMKKVADLETEATNREEDSGRKEEAPEGSSGEWESQEMKSKLVELEQVLGRRDQEVEALREKISQQDQALAEALARNEKPGAEAEHAESSSEGPLLQAKVSSLEAECQSLQKKVQEAQESRKETIRKAKEKDRHHREQLKQQKEEYKELVERLEAQNGEREALLTQLRQLEAKGSSGGEEASPTESKPMGEETEKQRVGDWLQEDWVDFAAPETDSAQPPPGHPEEGPADGSDVPAAGAEEALQALRREAEHLSRANQELQEQLRETGTSLSLREAELLEAGQELQSLREKEGQIDALLLEMAQLREQHHQAQLHAENLQAEVDAAARAASTDHAAAVANLQAEVEDFKHFLDSKNSEIQELSQALRQQDALLQSMQDAVSQKDQLMASLQEELTAEREKTRRLEVEVPQKQEEEKDGQAKVQQLQRKLQAALISRKEALKENKTQKEELASSQALLAELQEKMQTAEGQVEKLRAEKAQLIEEVDRALVENQSLGSSCESLKLVLEGVLSEKDAFRRDAELAKEEAARASREWEDKVSGMKEEYETLLKSYENVSDEAERVRKVLEAARQERQELAAKVRTQEAGRQEAERQAQEAQKEVEVVKDKMRKFAKTKQQKILELEEENEKLREAQERPERKREEKDVVEGLKGELEATRAELELRTAERNSLGQQMDELRERLAQRGAAEARAARLGSGTVLEEAGAAQQLQELGEELEDQDEEAPKASPAEGAAERGSAAPAKEASEGTETAGGVSVEEKTRELEAEKELWQQQKVELESQLASLEKDLQDSREKEVLLASLETSLRETKDRERSLMEESSRREVQAQELLRSLETEKDNLEERLMNQLAQLNGSIAGYQQEAADNREHLAQLQREVERLETARAELDAQASCERDRAARLEEDMRQARRERAEAEAESGRRRELEQQLRSAQRVKEGSQSRARQLEELLREKQLEVRQLQKDSLQYQERISELAREVKAVQLAGEELQSKLETSRLETSNTAEELKRTEAELVGCRAQLDEAQRATREALAERSRAEESARQKEAALKAEAEQTLDSVRFRLGAELKQMELRLEDAYNEREKEEEATQEARETSQQAQAQAQQSQARLEESLARLAAFSRSMSSLQDDRDRVLDEARQWEARFNDALRGKEAEVREAETRARELTEQLQAESARREELRLSVDRLEKSEGELKNCLEEEKKKGAESEAALKEQKGRLEDTTAELVSTQKEARSLKEEAESLLQRMGALEEAAFAESLQAELHQKEQREVEMLGEKERAVAEAAEEARREAVGRARGAEEELEQRRRELREVEEKLRKSEEEGEHGKARLDSFTKAMGSLQDDRERVLNAYKQLEEKHLQTDDLHAEKAKLSAELHGHRDQLKQVLSMKDSQHKQQLAAQRERISSLERERRELEVGGRRDADRVGDRSGTGGRAGPRPAGGGAEADGGEGGDDAAPSREPVLGQGYGVAPGQQGPGAGQGPGAEQGRSSRAAEPLRSSAGEVWGLKNALQALQNDRERLVGKRRQRSARAPRCSSASSPCSWSGSRRRRPSWTGRSRRVAQLGAGELAEVSRQLQEERAKNDGMLGVITRLEGVVEAGRREVEALRSERLDWMAQAEHLKQQTLATLADRDQQLRRLTATLEEARSRQPRAHQELCRREVGRSPGSPRRAERSHQFSLCRVPRRWTPLLGPHSSGARWRATPTERSSRSSREGGLLTGDLRNHRREECVTPVCLLLHVRLEEETQHRFAAEEQLMAAQDRLKRSHSQRRSAQEDEHSETAVFIQPPDGAVTHVSPPAPSE
ncbi:unnamed protein product, partial [Tetraodon nigroviridis]